MHTRPRLGEASNATTRGHNPLNTVYLPNYLLSFLEYRDVYCILYNFPSTWTAFPCTMPNLESFSKYQRQFVSLHFPYLTSIIPPFYSYLYFFLILKFLFSLFSPFPPSFFHFSSYSPQKALKSPPLIIDCLYIPVSMFARLYTPVPLQVVMMLPLLVRTGPPAEALVAAPPPADRRITRTLSQNQSRINNNHFRSSNQGLESDLVKTRD